MIDRKHTFSVIVPVYNEEHSINDAVLQNIKVFQSLNLDFEIIIVNDGSIDKTGEIAENIACNYRNVYCFHHKKNTGLGGAFKTGVNHATREYIILAPVDSPLFKHDIEVYIPRLDVCDIIVGVRAERVGYSRFGLFSSFVYNRILVPILFNIGIDDVNWIQVYKRNIFSDGIIDITNSGLFFLVEILVKAKRKRLIIAEVPAQMKKRIYGKASNTRFTVIGKTLIDMVKFYFKLRKEAKRQ